MVILNYVEENDPINRESADIFRAAANDDINELRRSISEGQSLDLVEQGTGFNPIMIALLQRSESFLAEAMKLEFDPWHRDPNERLAIDHANALGLRAVQRELLLKMYPPGWSKQLPKEPAP